MKKSVAIVVCTLVLAAFAVSCQQGAVMWAACAPAASGDTTGTDGDYVLVCQNSSWVPIMTVDEYVRISRGEQITIASLPTRPPIVVETGFSTPFSGPERYESLAPTKATHSSQLNEPIGLERADEIARGLGLERDLVLTDEQFVQFITGGGVDGSLEGAALADRTVQIFTNTNGRPLTSDVDGIPTETVLGSYGLFVDKDGLLMSLANSIAPTRIANVLLAPVAACPEKPLCGYMNTWFLNNDATDSLVQLYESAYTVEAVYGNQAQQISGAAQLVPNTKGGGSYDVGMSMAPALWLTNFALMYTLKPAIAAQMPAYWTPIPTSVVDAIQAADDGYVPYSDYASDFATSD